MRLVSRLLRLILAPFTLFFASVVRAQPVAESLGDGIVRMWPDATAREQTLPSLAIVPPRPALGPAPEGWRVVPQFSMERGGRVVRIATERGTSLYGTGEVGGPLERSGRRIVTWNTDAFGYDSQTESLYQSHPWVLAVRADGSSFGVLADTPGRVVIDLASGIELRAQGPAFPIVIIDRESPQAVLRALAELVGRMPLPPRWALGFQQCRYSYAPASELRQIAEEFRARAIPCDVLWMDIDYMERYRTFTFDPIGFADPKGLTSDLRAKGFRNVWILDPGIRREPGHFVYDQGTRGDHWVKSASGEPFIGKVWPGECVFPDFTRAATRAWWSRLTVDFIEQAGADGIWNDMNEPAVFERKDKTMPETNRHDADPELGGPGPHTRYHNVYGMLMARATREAMLTARPDRRPFVLSRANHLGGQRYAAAWTGDNRSNPDHLTMAVPMVLNLGLSGQPFAGPDIGGYADPLTGDEYAAWIGIGALLPFSRAHTEKGNIRKEPWSFGPRIEAIAKRAIETRYRLLPYLYTVFEESARTGLPVARPAFFTDPGAAWLRGHDHEFLLGDDVLVTARWGDSSRGRTCLADDPARWREVSLVPGEATPFLPTISVRAGAIVPIGPVTQWSDEQPLADVELLVSLDATGAASGTLYEDAGDGFEFERGEVARTTFSARLEGGTVRVRREVAGDFALPEARRYRVTLLGAPRGAHVEGP